MLANHKGQLSIDLLLAIIAANVFFVLLLSPFAGNFSAQVSEQDSRNDARVILLDFYGAVGRAKANPNLVMTYTSPVPKQRGNLGYDCKINKDPPGHGNAIEVDILCKGCPDSDANVAIYNGLDMSAIRINNAVGHKTFDCGQTVTIAGK